MLLWLSRFGSHTRSDLQPGFEDTTEKNPYCGSAICFASFSQTMQERAVIYSQLPADFGKHCTLELNIQNEKRRPVAGCIALQRVLKKRNVTWVQMQGQKNIVPPE